MGRDENRVNLLALGRRMHYLLVVVTYHKRLVHWSGGREMPGVNTTIDARAALRSVVKARYGRALEPGSWSTVLPSDSPPKGLGSADADDWQITLERCSAKMSSKGYGMAEVSRDEADDARSEALDGSVALLVSKASGEPSVARMRSQQNLALLAGGALTALAIGLAAGRHLSRKAER